MSWMSGRESLRMEERHSEWRIQGWCVGRVQGAAPDRDTTRRHPTARQAATRARASAYLGFAVVLTGSGSGSSAGAFLYRWAFVAQPEQLESPLDREMPKIEEVVARAPADCEFSSGPKECRAARRVLQVLRSGTTSCRAAKAISVGTVRIEKGLYLQTQSLFEDGTKGEMILIAADWGFGKSHMRMLLSNHLSERGIPFVHEGVDARAASLAHIHRSVPRWLERIRFGRSTGLRNALTNGHLHLERARRMGTSQQFRLLMRHSRRPLRQRVGLALGARTSLQVARLSVPARQGLGDPGVSRYFPKQDGLRRNGSPVG